MRSALKIKLSKWDKFINYVEAYSLNIALIAAIIALFVFLGSINYLCLWRY